MKGLPEHPHIHLIKAPEEFCSIFHVFGNPPYNEIWKHEDMIKEFNLINSHGYPFGYYTDEGLCVGLVALRTTVPGEHPITVDDSLYLSDLCVLHKYRKQGVAKSLIQYVLEVARMIGVQKVFLRTLEDHISFEYEVFKSLGFEEIYDACQIISHPRFKGSDNDVRIFMEVEL